MRKLAAVAYESSWNWRYATCPLTTLTWIEKGETHDLAERERLVAEVAEDGDVFALAEHGGDVERLVFPPGEHHPQVVEERSRSL